MILDMRYPPLWIIVMLKGFILVNTIRLLLGVMRVYLTYLMSLDINMIQVIIIIRFIYPKMISHY